MNRRITVIAIASLVIALGLAFYLIRGRFRINGPPATVVLRSPTASNEIQLRDFQSLYSNKQTKRGQA